jgi:hypothetical protein
MKCNIIKFHLLLKLMASYYKVIISSLKSVQISYTGGKITKITTVSNSLHGEKKTFLKKGLQFFLTLDILYLHVYWVSLNREI